MAFCEVRMKRTFHIWVKNKKTDEVKCKRVRAKSFSAASSDAHFFHDTLKERTRQDWYIMAINDVDFSHDPKTPII